MPMSLTITQLVQLYAPLAGLLALAFWSGVLTQKVKNQGDDIDELRARMDDFGDVTPAVSERLVRLEVKMDGVINKSDALDRNMSGVQRQLANLVTRPLHEFKPGGAE